ncbi:hypothetical protein [Candidatus Accumulibacter sp. ACC005]|uniref:hypothetical protein n=1 Tax=Candidatus Accumulibacter sp. ACC005 TaxID=2823331 RepID=UPI0025BC738F|nr:hypothetical protein [Candidatus Accumulibacter sp. ACC005]
MAATWAFIPPTAIRNAWIAERAEVYAIAGKGESDVYGRTLDDMEKSLASDFRKLHHRRSIDRAGTLWEFRPQRLGAGPDRRDLVVDRPGRLPLQVLMGWLVPGIPLVMAAYSDGQLVREIRKYSFVAQSPIRHSLGVRVLWAVLVGLAVWMIVPLPMPSLLPPLLIVSISYALWLWVSNLQKRL